MIATERKPIGTGPGGGGSGMCQLQAVIRSSPRAPRAEEAGLSPVIRVTRALHRGLDLRVRKKIRRLAGSVLDLVTFRKRSGAPANAPAGSWQPARLAAGDLVRVRSREDIEATLDRWRQLKGCGFLAEMADYCGTTQRVLKRVERFIDERDSRLKKASGVVLLESVMCSGASVTGGCDRSCLFFWREEWLEKQD